MAWANLKFAVAVSTAALVLVGGTPAFLLAGSPPPQPSTASFQVEGTVTCKVTGKGGHTRLLRQDSFTVTVAGCRWHLKTVPLKRVENDIEVPRISAYAITSTDLTNLYYLDVLDTNAPLLQVTHSGLRHAKVPSSANTAFGIIGSGSVPYGLGDTAGAILWYAFASECYFQTVTNNYVHPVTWPEGPAWYGKDFRVLSQWNLTPTSPKLPRFIALSCYREQMETGRPWSNRLDVLRSTNCVFSVRSFTNCGSLILPKEVAAQCFVFPVATNYAITALESTISATVTRVVLNPPPVPFIPQIKGKTAFSDLRRAARNAPAAFPSLTNWPPPPWNGEQ